MRHNYRWIGIALLVLVSMIVNACAPPTPVVVEKEKTIEKTVVETVVVEKEKTVEKPVVETVVVEKEIIPKDPTDIEEVKVILSSVYKSWFFPKNTEIECLGELTTESSVFHIYISKVVSGVCATKVSTRLLVFSKSLEYMGEYYLYSEDPTEIENNKIIFPFDGDNTIEFKNDNPPKEVLVGGKPLTFFSLAPPTPTAVTIMPPTASGTPTPMPTMDIPGVQATQTVVGAPEGMVFVPAGEFIMGSPEGGGYGDERPQRTVYLDAFYIGKYEVTNAEYKECVGLDLRFGH